MCRWIGIGRIIFYPPKKNFFFFFLLALQLDTCMFHRRIRMVVLTLVKNGKYCHSSLHSLYTLDLNIQNLTIYFVLSVDRGNDMILRHIYIGRICNMQPKYDTIITSESQFSVFVLPLPLI